ncbi:MAG: phosphate ABC transporter ATP-binding protein, partial [Planctomycetota bacterium]
MTHSPSSNRPPDENCCSDGRTSAADNRSSNCDGSTFTVGPVESGPPCCEPHPQIHVEDLTLSYGGTRVLEGVSLTINRGCITALIGPSGCGKTSFLSSLNRLTDLLPGCRVEGRIRIDNVDVLSPATDVVALRRRVGMIFQKPNPFPLSIRGNLELPLREHGTASRGERQEKIEAALRDVGLWGEVHDRLD